MRSPRPRPHQQNLVCYGCDFLSYKPGRRKTGTQLKQQATESTREGKTVNGSMGRRVNVFFERHKVLIVILGRSKPEWTNIHLGYLELIYAPTSIHVSPKLIPNKTPQLATKP